MMAETPAANGHRILITEEEIERMTSETPAELDERRARALYLAHAPYAAGAMAWEARSEHFKSGYRMRARAIRESDDAAGRERAEQAEARVKELEADCAAKDAALRQFLAAHDRAGMGSWDGDWEMRGKMDDAANVAKFALSDSPGGKLLALVDIVRISLPSLADMPPCRNDRKQGAFDNAVGKLSQALAALDAKGGG